MPTPVYVAAARPRFKVEGERLEPLALSGV